MVEPKKLKQVEFNLHGKVTDDAVRKHVRDKISYKGKIVEITIYPASKSGYTRVRVALEPE